jgi:peptidoglycan lytic transglycosylase D
MMATPSVRRAAAAVGWLLLLLTWSARGAEPNGNPKEAPARGVGTAKPAPKRGLAPARGGDPGARKAMTGGPTADDVALGPESLDLRSLREAERALFPSEVSAPGNVWPTDSTGAFPRDGRPQVTATGVPPSAPLPRIDGTPPAPPGRGRNDTEGGGDRSWLEHLVMPDLPVRWDERVVQYLQFFRDDARGRVTFANLYRHSGRWRELVRRVLRSKSLPEDLVWLSMVESGFDPTARSSAGAAGLWQFMPETAKIYGLTIDRWIDQRFSVSAATEAAATFLDELHARFGSWDLALAGFNMGYVGLSSVVRRYNTNDFWSLARAEGTLPWETTLYVPKVLAVAIIAHNLAAFGFGDIALDGPIETDEVDAPPGTQLAALAQAVGCPLRDIEALNPELRAARAPPASDGRTSYPIHVPRGRGAAAALGLARLRKAEPALERYVVRFGETLDQVAAARKTSAQKLVELNAIAPGETVRGGTVLLVPRVVPPADAEGAAPSVGAKANVVVPADVYVYPDRERVFYRVLVGDALNEIAAALHVSPDELRRWNDIDPTARLQEGMTLQAFVAKDTDLSGVVLSREADVRVLAVGSDEFFAALEHDKGFKRIAVRAKAGDTIESIGRRYDVSARTMERINRRPRGEVLRPGEIVVVYLPRSASLDGRTNATASNDPAPNGPLPAPPAPNLLP